MISFLAPVAEGSSGRGRGSSSGVELSKRLVREHVERRHFAEAERIEPPKQRAVSKRGPAYGANRANRPRPSSIAA
jgi:hypothetical protein